MVFSLYNSCNIYALMDYALSLFVSVISGTDNLFRTTSATFLLTSTSNNFAYYSFFLTQSTGFFHYALEVPLRENIDPAFGMALWMKSPFASATKFHWVINVPDYFTSSWHHALKTRTWNESFGIRKSWERQFKLWKEKINARNSTPNLSGEEFVIIGLWIASE